MKAASAQSPIKLAPSEKKRRWLRWLVAAYVVLLLCSHLTQKFRPVVEQRRGEHYVDVQAVNGEQFINQPVNIAYRTYQQDAGRMTAYPEETLVLLHGSPGQADDFRQLAPLFAERYRLIVPDLPGFGDSTKTLPDYSIRAHARYVLAMLDQLKISRAHFLGFSMGGGVALNIAALAPQRVASLTMLSAIGAQEMELLGDYHLNHAIHGLQLAGFRFVQNGVPHFGALNLDTTISYARNFYDSDQRPLRGILARYAGPMQIIHGKNDPLCPVEVAVEAARIVPQSELHLLDSDHFMVFRKDSGLAPLLDDFIERAVQGSALTRDHAEAVRVAQSAQPFNSVNLPKFVGVAAVVFFLLVIAATLVSEDLTTISVGVMVAQGRTGFLFGTLACFAGIFVGDVLLFLAGRYLGRPALSRAPLKWLLSAEAVERSSAWFARNGVRVIALSRFVPGMRLPTYFAAGALKTNFWWFAFYFALACAVWTPLLVGLSAWLGEQVVNSALVNDQYFWLKVLLTGFALMIVIRLLLRAMTWRGRRMLLSQWRRLTRWEFWPMWAIYPPVIFYITWLAIKHRSLTLFTAANPAIPAGGFVGESKAEIFKQLAHRDAAEFLPQTELIAASANTEARIAQARQFIAAQQLSFPVVLKPDAGQRGQGVEVIRRDEQLADYFRRNVGDTLVQEYAGGEEFGVFYYRMPDEDAGHIFAITEKRFPVVTGDGVSTLEQLILSDERAVCLAQFYCDRNRARLSDVIPAGERVQLVEIGAHSRGTIFYDGTDLKTPALEAAIDRVSRCYQGFYFGRYDVRVASLEAFQAGRDFKVIELNGVTSEATSIYDPKNSVFAAWSVLCKQWRLAFEIGAQNRARGIAPASVREILRHIAEFYFAGSSKKTSADDFSEKDFHHEETKLEEAHEKL